MVNQYISNFLTELSKSLRTSLRPVFLLTFILCFSQQILRLFSISSLNEYPYQIYEILTEEENIWMSYSDWAPSQKMEQH